MRIAANLGVKDEVELIEQAIAHLRRIGVDLIIACDNGSTDGTAEILDKYRCGSMWVVHLDDLEPPDIWMKKNVDLVKKAEAEWVIFVDADEFWLPASGNLKECAGLADADVLTVDRFNVPPGPTGALAPIDLLPEHYGQLLLIVDPIRDFRARLKGNPDLPWIMSPRGPKVMARPELIIELHDGMHDIVASDPSSVRRFRPKDLFIAHFPFTTRTRFERKIRNVRRFFKVHDSYLGPNTAWHWRKWLAAADQGQLQEEFDRQIVEAEILADLRSRGVICSAAELFRARAEDINPPDYPMLPQQVP